MRPNNSGDSKSFQQKFTGDPVRTGQTELVVYTCNFMKPGKISCSSVVSLPG